MREAPSQSRPGFRQTLGHLSVAVLLRHSSAAVPGDGGVVGFGLKQHVDNRLAAFVRGTVEGCVPIVARGIWLGFGLK